MMLIMVLNNVQGGGDNNNYSIHRAGSSNTAGDLSNGDRFIHLLLI